MSRHLLAGLAAVVCAALAAGLILVYAAGADQRALAELSPVQVLVVTGDVPAGTPAEELGDFVGLKEVPAATVVTGGVRDLQDIAGQLTLTPLVPGEQLLLARFAAPETEEAPAFEVPAGFHQLTVQLEQRRVVGGRLAAGDTVGVFVSLDELGTHLTLHKVLVTGVAGAATEVVTEDGGTVEQPPAETLMVTLALSAPDAEKVVFAAEFGAIWLSLEPADAPETDTRIVNPENVYS